MLILDDEGAQASFFSVSSVISMAKYFFRSSAMNPIVIIGSGLAGYTVARELRKLDASSPLTIISADGGEFYAKPMLSNAFAQGKSAAQLVTTPAATMAAQLNATLLPRTQVTAIDPVKQSLTTASGRIDYRRLVLAIGADPIRLPLGGNAADTVLSINDLDDYARFRARLTGHGRVAIIGAGLIGSEFANDLAGAGYHVMVVDPSPYPLASLVPEVAGHEVEAALRHAGVRWHGGRTVLSVDGESGAYRLGLNDGSTIEADIVLSAVGLRPRTALAQSAGLAIDRGIVVDRYLRASAANIFAIGDCAEIDGQVRPYVMPIMHAAKALAASLAGTPTTVVFPIMPVLVKTPACPVAVHPVARDAVGNWSNEPLADGLRLRFSNLEGHLAGFALVGAQAVAERASFAKQVRRDAGINTG
jgi:rubredoxin-NAD+ reductase